MDGGLSNFLLTGVWVIPLVLVVIIAGFYALAQNLRRRNTEELKNLRGELRRFQSDRHQLEVAAQNYSPDDPEPYGSAVADLFERLVQIAEMADDLEHRHIALQERLRELLSNRLRLVMGVPIFWGEMRNGVSTLRNELWQARQALEAAMQVEEQLYLAGWEVALQARDAFALQQQSMQIMAELRASNLLGQAFDEASHQEKQNQAALGRIPRLFIEGEQEQVLQQAGPQSIAQVHEILTTARPALEQLSLQAQAWEKKFTETEDRVAVMRRALDELENTLTTLPAELEVGDFHDRFNAMRVIGRNLQATLGRMEVDSMDMVGTEAQRVTQSAQELGGQVKRARRNLAALQSLIPEMDDRFKQLSLKLATLGGRSNLPVQWGHSMEELAELNRRVNTLGSANQTRTPEQVEQHVAQAVELNASQKELAGRFEQVEQAHLGLVALLTGPEFVQIERWMQSADGIVQQVKSYAPENWSRADAVASLPDEVTHLNKRMGSLLPAEQSEAIPETDILKRLEGLRQLALDAQKLQKRMEYIQARLADIQQNEKQATEQIENAQNVLSQLSFIVRSNELLARVAMPEIERLDREIQMQRSELGQRGHGSIQSKASKTVSLVGRLEASANRWLDQLNQDLLSLVQQLSDALTELDEIARLDEAAIEQARRSLSEWHTFDTGSTAKSHLRMDELVAEFKRRSDYWQRCLASAAALQDLLVPILESYDQADQNRQAVRQQLADATTWLRQGRGWPPSAANLDAERLEVERLEAEWQGLDQRLLRGMQFMQQLSNLSNSYQTLAARIKQTTDRAAQEQSKIDAQLNEIEELISAWERHASAYQDNPLARSEINDMLTGVDRKMSQVQQQARRGSRSYDQVVQDLNEILRSLRFFQAALDEDHAIDRDGWVKNKR